MCAASLRSSSYAARKAASKAPGAVSVMTGLSGNMRKVMQAPRPVGARINLREMAIMARLHCRIGAVRRVERLTTAWRGAHGKPITPLDVGGLAVRVDGAPSVAEGDLVTVVGRPRAGGL